MTTKTQSARNEIRLTDDELLEVMTGLALLNNSYETIGDAGAAAKVAELFRRLQNPKQLF